MFLMNYDTSLKGSVKSYDAQIVIRMPERIVTWGSTWLISPSSIYSILTNIPNDCAKVNDLKYKCVR